MSDYTNTGIYVVIKNADTLPKGAKLPVPGEGANHGVLDDGSAWYKNCLMTPDEMRAIVHAEDAGLLEIKSSDEMRAIKQQENSKAETL